MIRAELTNPVNLIKSATSSYLNKYIQDFKSINYSVTYGLPVSFISNNFLFVFMHPSHAIFKFIRRTNMKKILNYLNNRMESQISQKYDNKIR